MKADIPASPTRIIRLGRAGRAGASIGVEPGLERSPRRSHRAGFRDRNLDLRNLIVEREGEHWNVTKIDSPRWRTASGWMGERLAQFDRARLQRDLAIEGFGDF